LASQPADLIPHVSYLAVWALAAVLLVTGTASRAKRARIGALLAAGSAVATFGFFFADAGTAIAEGGHVIGAGLVLSLAGWLLAAAGAVVAMAGVRPVHSGESGLQRVRIALPIVAAALGTAIAFAPSWDSYNLQTASGQSTTVVLGNAFSNPGAVIAGNVAVMVGLVLVAVAAAFWRPVVTGAALLAGAIVPMLAQFVSALVQVGEATPASQFGISPAQASEAQLHITSGLTATFTVFSVFLAALIVLWAGMFVKVKMQLERRNESWAHDPQPTSFHASAP